LTRRPLALIAAGGAVGAVGRYGLTRAFPVGADTFPTTTFAINVAGAFVLALLLETLLRRGTPDHWLRLLVGVGVLGAFTTFSTFVTEVALLVRDDHSGTAALYVAASVITGSAAVIAGLFAAGWRRLPVPDEGES
jgi:CrcB protein